MAMSTTVSMVGLAGLIALPGQVGPVTGAEGLHVTVDVKAEEGAGERLRVGDRVEYTIKVRNTGREALPEAQLVQFLPNSMRYVFGAPDGVEAAQAIWEQPLEPGEGAEHTVTAEVVEIAGGTSQPVSTFCLRPDAGAQVTACTSSVHQVHRRSPTSWWSVAGTALVVSVACVVTGCLRRRGDQTPLSEPGPEPSIPEEKSPARHLDAQR